MKSQVRTLLVLLGFTLALAACGDGDDGVPPPDPTPTPPAIAQALELSLANLEGTWMGNVNASGKEIRDDVTAFSFTIGGAIPGDELRVAMSFNDETTVAVTDERYVVTVIDSETLGVVCMLCMAPILAGDRSTVTLTQRGSDKQMVAVDEEGIKFVLDL